MNDNNQPDIPTILKNINSAKRIGLILPQQLNVDLLGAATALFAALTSQSDGGPKTVMVFSAAKGELPDLPFLKNMPQIHSALNNSNQLAIKVSNRNAQPGELRYEKSEDGLTVYITPKEGEFKEQDVAVLPSSANFDLVIILGAANFEQMGTVYTENTKLFFETPNVNIDINPANEYFGTVNFVQTTATSVSEAVMDIIEATPGALTNDIVSTALLAGIISQTSSFRDPKTTPQVLLKASRLVSAGARQQDIIQHLFKTKPLPQLQLWGRALARLTSLPEKQMLTAVVTKSDLEKTQLGIDALPTVVRDIIEMITGYSLIVLLAELPSGGVQILMAGLPFEDLSKITSQIYESENKAVKLIPLTGKYGYASLYLSSTLMEAQEKLNKITENRKSVV